MNYIHPRVWLVVGSVFSFFFVLILTIQPRIKKHFHNQKIEEVFNAQARKEGDIKVVLLCSSMGRQAISDGHILNHQMESYDSIKFEFVKVSFSNANLKDFTQNQVLREKLVDYEPDYILLQESYLFMDQRRTLSSYSLRSTINYRQILELFDGPDTPKKKIADNYKIIDVYADSLSSESRFFNIRKKIRETPVLEEFTKGLSATILVAELPLPGHFEGVMDSIRQTQPYQSILQKEKTATDFTYLEYPIAHPFAFFYDESHMNDFGEAVYTKWLLQKISVIHKG